MKTARFERLSFIENAVLIVIMTSVTVFSFPVPVKASVENKTRLVFEIKNFPIIKIAENLTIPTLKTESLEAAASEKIQVQVTPPPAVTPKAIKPQSKNAVPPKAVNKIYMQEPEIRAYICPKLGDKCDIFIAVLKAENGTHECSRDNRGLNKNGSIDIGLAQINWKPGNPWHTFENLQDCKYNLDVALEMYSRRGFQPWYAYTKGAYKKHLPAVLASKATIAAEPITQTN